MVKLIVFRIKRTIYSLIFTAIAYLLIAVAFAFLIDALFNFLKTAFPLSLAAFYTALVLIGVAIIILLITVIIKHHHVKSLFLQHASMGKNDLRYFMKNHLTECIILVLVSGTVLGFLGFSPTARKKTLKTLKTLMHKIGDGPENPIWLKILAKFFKE